MNKASQVRKLPLAGFVALLVEAAALACPFLIGDSSELFVVPMLVIVLAGTVNLPYSVMASFFVQGAEDAELSDQAESDAEADAASGQIAPPLLGWLARAQLLLSLVVLALGRLSPGIAPAGVILLVGGYVVRVMCKLPKPANVEIFRSTMTANIAGLASAAMMIVIAYAYADEAFRIPTGSMEPTLYGDPTMGDRAIVNKLAYEIGDPQRGDIAIFRFPLGRSQPYVKRVAGLPGERLVVADGDVYIQKKRGEVPEIWRKTGRVRASSWLEVFRYEGAYASHFKGLRGKASEEGSAIKLGAAAGFRYPREGSITNHNPTADQTDSSLYDKEAVKDVRISASLGKGVVIKVQRDEGLFELDVHGGTLRISGNEYKLESFKAYNVQKVRFALVDGEAIVEVGGKIVLRHEFGTVVQERFKTLAGASHVDTTINELLQHGDSKTLRLERSSGAVIEFANIGDAESSVGKILIERDIHYGGRHKLVLDDGSVTTEAGLGLPWAAEAGPDGFIMLGDNSENSLDSRGWFEVEYQILGEDPVRAQFQDMGKMVPATAAGLTAFIEAMNALVGATNADMKAVEAELLAQLKSRPQKLDFQDIYGIPRSFDVSEIRGLTLKRVPAVPRKLIDGQLIGSVFPTPRFVD